MKIFSIQLEEIFVLLEGTYFKLSFARLLCRKFRASNGDLHSSFNQGCQVVSFSTIGVFLKFDSAQSGVVTTPVSNLIVLTKYWKMDHFS